MARAAARTADRPVVAGVGISHPDRTLFPGVPASKLDLARYYERVSQWMLRDLIDRPLTLVHCPKGVPPGGAQKGVDCRFMKHAKLWGPSAIRRVRIRDHVPPESPRRRGRTGPQMSDLVVQEVNGVATDALTLRGHVVRRARIRSVRIR